MSSLRQAAEHANIMMLSRSNEELSSPSVCLGNLIMPVIQHSKIHMTSPVGFMTELCMGLNGRGKLNVVGLYGELKPLRNRCCASSLKPANSSDLDRSRKTSSSNVTSTMLARVRTEILDDLWGI